MESADMARKHCCLGPSPIIRWPCDYYLIHVSIRYFILPADMWEITELNLLEAVFIFFQLVTVSQNLLQCFSA